MQQFVSFMGYLKGTLVRIALLSLSYHAKKQCSIIIVIIIMIIIILNSTCKVQNLLKNSDHTKNMKNIQNYEFGKAWRNKCVFKWDLNYKKLAVLWMLLGSEFQTVGVAKWNECSPADLRLTRGILSSFSEDDQRMHGGWYMC